MAAARSPQLSRVSIDSLCDFLFLSHPIRTCVDMSNGTASSSWLCWTKKLFIVWTTFRVGQGRPSASSSTLTSTSASSYRRASPFSTRSSAVCIRWPTPTSSNCFSSSSDWFVFQLFFAYFNDFIDISCVLRSLVGQHSIRSDQSGRQFHFTVAGRLGRYAGTEILRPVFRLRYAAHFRRHSVAGEPHIYALYAS